MTSPMNETPSTIAQAAAALRAGTTTATELAQVSIARADALDDKVGIYIKRFDEKLLEAATAIDTDLASGKELGPLAGIPLGIKDIITTIEAPTTGQSLVQDLSWGPGIGDAVVVQRLRAAGALITGKTTTMEFAMGLPDPAKPFPICRNPWDLDTWAGGSSSGTGSGIAAGVILGGLGTDTGGSIRNPAAFCSVTGLMPTAGRVPKSGCLPLGYSLDHIGPLARSAEDCAIMLNALAGYDDSDATAIDVPTEDYTAALSGDLSGLTIGVDRTSGRPADIVDAALDPLLDDAIAVLLARGATVVDVALPFYDEAAAVLSAINSGEYGAFHRPDAQSQFENFVASFRMALGRGTFVSAADYVQAQRVRRVIVKAVNTDVFSKVDLVLSPTAWVGATPLEALIEKPWQRPLHGNTSYWDVTGHPAIAVPMGFNADGLPLSFQLIAKPFAEATALAGAYAYQQETDFHLAVPPLAG
ncbi:amidase [Cumulibacter soli]|uniref:amidase n=1 Tax=Cumulibacter soli TaxID=2546344 RepID=UPI001ABB6CDA|nr:amidase [Cumulibacter soli]